MTDSAPPVLVRKRRGRRPARSVPDTDGAWTEGRLVVTGPAEAVRAFVAAARGPGVAPWRVDYQRIEEDAFHLALRGPPARRGLSVEGCRRLARQFREAVEARDASVAARPACCPLDLHVLLPVPGDILALGWAHPEAESWLLAQWGATELRRVVLLPSPAIGRRLRAGHAKAGFAFWALGGRGPDAALLAARFPELAFRRTL